MPVAKAVVKAQMVKAKTGVDLCTTATRSSLVFIVDLTEVT